MFSQYRMKKVFGCNPRYVSLGTVVYVEITDVLAI